MKLKRPPQPLVFRFSRGTALRAAAERLWTLFPGARAGLALFHGKYYLTVPGRLLDRPLAERAVGAAGECLGPAAVLYAHCAEHGLELSRNALADLCGRRR